MRIMAIDEARGFLMHGRRTGKLATTRADGRPHVAPIWFVLDDDGAVIFNTGADTLKGKSLRRDPRAVMVVDDENPPFAYVLVEGTCEISEDLEAMLPWSTRIGGRYMGAEAADAFGRRNAVAGELLVRLVPDKVIGRTEISD